MEALFDHGAYAPYPASFNMAAHVLAHADRLDGKIALEILGAGMDTCPSEQWSYRALKAAVLGTGAGLLARGLRPGDIVLMRLGNSVEFPIAYLGAIAVGLVPVPTSTQLTLSEVNDIIATLSPAAILRDDAITCPDDCGGDGADIIDLGDLVAMRDLPPAPYHMGDANRMAYIIFTSGTSGRPRAVMHAHRAIWARGMMYDGWNDICGDDRVLHAGAFNWTYTLGTGLMDPWAVGACALIPAPGTAPEKLPALLARHDATIFAAAPGVFRKMLKDNTPIDAPQLRHALSAGEKLSDTISQAWEKATDTRVFEAYGMSECSTFISASAADGASTEQTDSMQTDTGGAILGRPQAGRRVAILDVNDAQYSVVEHGVAGVIAVSHYDPGLMIGYYGDEAEFSARMRGEWFLTGDLAQMALDGQITYLGRNDDMMNAGGYRVSPIEVEAALHDFPGIDHIGVTDIEIKPDVRVIAAFYSGAAPLDETAMADYAATRLARYKCPRIFLYVKELPTGANGKIQRRALRPIYEVQNGQA